MLSVSPSTCWYKNKSSTNLHTERLLLHLRGSQYDTFVDQVKTYLQHVKRFSYGKQVGAIEKLIYGGPNQQSTHAQVNRSPPSHLDTSAAPTPPLLTEDTQSPQSSSLPSTNTSTVDGPIGDRKASTAAPIEVAATTNL